MDERTTWQGEVERLAWGGLGIGRLADGRIVLLDAPLALFPGEIVEAELTSKARHAEGRVTCWLRRDPARLEPACPVAESCGGCSLWGAGDRAAELKLAMVRDLLHRQLRDAPEPQWLPAPPDALRSRIQLHWDTACLGFHRRRTNKIVAVDACPLAIAVVSAAIPMLHAALVEGRLPDAPARWELACGTPPESVLAGSSMEPGQAWKLDGSQWQPATEPLQHRLGGNRILQPPGVFFQACPQWAWDACGSVFADWDLRGDTLFDLYGGAGFFSLLLRERFRRFVLVEAHAAAVEAARVNLQPLRESGGQLEFHACPLEDWLPGLHCAPGDVVLLDPPRSGLPQRVSAALREAATGARALVLFGCDGMAFCRDVQRIGPAWRLEKLAAIDLFPNTAGLEFVGLLLPAD